MFILVAMIGMTLQSWAQTAFYVKKPPFSKYVKVVTDGVNIRQKPNVKSPRLIWTMDGIDGYNPEYLAWKGAQLKKGDKPVKATVHPVWDESGDWYRIQYSVETDEGLYFKDGYVMKKYCKEVQLKSLTLPAPNNMDIVKISNGAYKDYCFRTYTDWGDDYKLQIGKYVNGMFVFNYELRLSYDARSSETIVTDSELRFGKDLVINDWLIDLKKLSTRTKDLDKLFANVDKMDHISITYYGVSGDNKWYLITGVY